MNQPQSDSRQDAENKLIRLLYIVLFYLVFGVSEIILALVTIVQSVLNLLSDGPSRSLQEFGQSLSLYIAQIVEYLSYSSDQKPYPFDDWPEAPMKQEQPK